MGKRLSEDVVSDSDESMEDAPETTNVAEKASQQTSDVASEQDTSSSESGSGSESESESDGSDESDSNNADSRPSYNNKRAFFPPSGFKQSKPKTRPSPAISSALSNLEGKQVFHITAPSSLSISRIKEVAFGKAILGEPILSHKGVDYGLVANTQQQKQGSEALLVYDEATNTFVKKRELKNIESYNIQEIVRLPGLDSTQVPSTQEASKKQSKARPQPKHLRMRFHPVGSLNLPPETVGSSSESDAEEPTFRVPRKDLKEKSEKDLKRKADNEGESESKSKKSKKEKLSSQETDTRRDKEKKPSKHRDETSQERRARKEEKKRRKAEKAH
ncbi:hypothetical protein UA08_04291 [Talaromyces atroroseus]|uniref:DNA-directed RNA polymerase I subunit RPA34.5 n=1 Tax=Talaromyces atroroseus TaxID=1441469 RepID=A0A1Q5Q9I9_TALAT|nr:hypothetical protein UA08_04291 [Talaromyces atroroseus]OKL60784.1 hypothetical protein UA08_04291 [Talaromyces atroroseus]